jgi:hypothetical protein
MSTPVAGKGEALRITEGIHGTHHYHLSRVRPASVGKGMIAEPTALCGAWVMATELPLTTWGYRGHLGEHYCAICSRLPEGVAAIAQALVMKQRQQGER